MDTGWVQKLQQELSRQRSMLKSNDVGFVKPSINYGSVAGSSAKFFGQGILNLKRPQQAVEGGPFSMRTVTNNKQLYIAVQPGTVNGVVFEQSEQHIEGKVLRARTGFVILDCMSDGKIITRVNLKIEDSFEPAAPTAIYPPFAFKWPIAYVKVKGSGQSQSASIYPLIGKSSLVAFAAETARIPNSATNPAESFYTIYYTWIVSNSTDPIFITIET